MRGQYICFMEQISNYFIILFILNISGRLSPYFFDMITLINMTQNRNGNFACKGPMRGHYVFLMVKAQSFI